MTRELHSSIAARTFLESIISQGTKGDPSLISQVELWFVTARVFDTFGADLERKSLSFVNDIESFLCTYGIWYREWLPVIMPLSHLRLQGDTSDSIGGARSQTFDLYFCSSKLYLLSHIVRGSAQGPSEMLTSTHHHERQQDLIRQAFKSAMRIVKAVTSAIDGGVHLGALPSYLGTIAAFACILLLRISRSQHSHITSDEDKINMLQSLRDLSITLQSSLQSTTGQTCPTYSPTIPLVRIARASTTINLANNAMQAAAPLDRQCDDGAARSYDMHLHSPTLAADSSWFTSEFADLDFNFLGDMNIDWDGQLPLPLNH